MADPEKPKKPSKIPMIVWGSLTAFLLARTFWHPYRSVVSKGYPVACPGGSNCSPNLTIQGDGSATPVYAITSGVAAIASDGSVSIASDREPYIISYGPNPSQVFVTSGQKVGLGQEIAVMGTVQLSVTEIVRGSDGSITYRVIDPSSYLAARGLHISQSGDKASELWCSHGRNIVVPTATLNCGVRLPEPSALMLLPVTVTTE